VCGLTPFQQYASWALMFGPCNLDGMIVRNDDNGAASCPLCGEDVSLRQIRANDIVPYGDIAVEHFCGACPHTRSANEVVRSGSVLVAHTAANIRLHGNRMLVAFSKLGLGPLGVMPTWWPKKKKEPKPHDVIPEYVKQKGKDGLENKRRRLLPDDIPNNPQLNVNYHDDNLLGVLPAPVSGSGNGANSGEEEEDDASQSSSMSWAPAATANNDDDRMDVQDD